MLIKYSASYLDVSKKFRLLNDKISKISLHLEALTKFFEDLESFQESFIKFLPFIKKPVLQFLFFLLTKLGFP